MAASERLARVALAALILVGPLVLGWKLFGDAPETPLSPPPAKGSLVVVTATTWAAEPFDHPALGRLDRRAAGITNFRAPSPSKAACAASLWTGRWPTNHGVLSDELALAPDTWTLAEAARRSGLRTAVIAQEPIAARHGIGGFELASEGPRSVATLADQARQAIETFEGDDFVLWLHLADAGPGGAHVGEVLASVEDALVARGDQFDAALVVTGFRRPAGPPLWDRLAVPVRVQFPGRSFGGMRGKGIMQHPDPCGMILRLLRWEMPVPAHGEHRDTSRTRQLWFALRGGNAASWAVAETPERHEVRDVSGTTGIRYLCRGPGRPPLARDDLELLQLDESGAWVPVADDLREAVYRAHYYPHVRAFDRQATPAVPAGE